MKTLDELSVINANLSRFWQLIVDTDASRRHVLRGRLGCAKRPRRRLGAGAQFAALTTNQLDRASLPSPASAPFVNSAEHFPHQAADLRKALAASGAAP